MNRRWIVVALLVFNGCSAKLTQDLNSVTPSDEAGGISTLATSTDSPVMRDRKIIYTAQLHVLVQDFSIAKERLAALVKSHDGYLADVSIERNTGERRSGVWQARIPVDRYDAFLSALSEVGVSQSIKQTAQDVTEEFVDIEARLNNKKRLEQRILDLLDSNAGELKDVIDVERELERVRGEIEQAEGRLRFLKNRTAFTTVSIRIQERFDFVPPEALSLTSRLMDAWRESLQSMQRAGSGILVGFAYALPWIVLWSVILLPVAWFVRRRQRRTLP